MNPELAALYDEWGRCTRCDLSAFRSNVVMGRGRAPAWFMFVGEGPGADEDRYGKPFVGKSGVILMDAIRDAGLLGRYYITNIVACRPPSNRVPHPNEVQLCKPRLERLIEVVQPKVLFTIGGEAMRSFLHGSGGVTHLHGMVFITPFGGVDRLVVPLIHPSYILRNGGKSSQAYSWLVNDIRNADRPIAELSAGVSRKVGTP